MNCARVLPAALSTAVPSHLHGDLVVGKWLTSNISEGELERKKLGDAI